MSYGSFYGEGSGADYGTMLHAAAAHHHHNPAAALTMSMCHLDFPKMQASLPGQIYTSNAFEGILEIRKEKSRDAARSRRGKENYEFYELAKLLPLPGAITSQLDKASIIRLTISYLKLRDFSYHGDPPWQRDVSSTQNKTMKNPAAGRRRSVPSVTTDLYETHQGTHILQSLDGFVFSLSNDGRFLYISETVSIYLGLSQVEMTGSSIFDYTHYEDHRELAEQLGLSSSSSSSTSTATRFTSSSSSSSTPSDERVRGESTGDGRDSPGGSPPPRAVTPSISDRATIMNPSPNKGFERCFCVRMKSTLTKRGVHVKCSGYRVVQVLARMRPQFSFSLTRKHPPPLLGLVGMAIALPPPTITELLIDSDMFVTRLSPELKVTYCEPRISDMMDISADDLTNRNLYDYCHAEDLQKLRKGHIDLLNKGQVLTDYYRLMNKHGGYVWLQTCATIICNSKNVDEQNIIAINYVLSGIEYSGCVMNMEQYKVVSPNTEPDQSDHSESEQGPYDSEEKKDHRTKSPSCRDRTRETSCDQPSKPANKKRKHSSSHNVQSPQDGTDSLYSQRSMDYMNGLYGQDDGRFSNDKLRLDNKNSRRKMDKPRKRKKESESENDTNVDLSISSTAEQTSSSLNLLNNESPTGGDVGMNKEAAMVSVISTVNGPSSNLSNGVQSASPDLANKICSPVPEDLSVRVVVSSPVTAQSPPTQQSITPNMATTTDTAQPTAADQSWVAPPVSAVDTSTENTGTGSSVRDLEEAMNKHLPTMQAPEAADPYRTGFAGSDYGVMDYQKHKSTIQWIGTHNSHSGMPDTLPATNLLRSLYASRESVIRPNIYNPRPQYYGDPMQNTLLTPPGGTTDPYKDSFSTAQSKTPPSSYSSLMGGYASSPISVAMGTNMSDSYNMTPPSSVSPQEKYGSTYGSSTSDQCHADMSAAQLRLQYDGTLGMPIKPQAYPLPAHANSHMSAYDRSTSQYPSAGYYGTTAGFGGYNHAASPTPAHYRDTSKAGNVW